VTTPDEIWIPLVDEPFGELVSQIVMAHPEIAEQVDTPRRILAFRTFAYIRVGILLGKLLVEEDVGPADGTDAWVARLLAEPRHRQAVEREVLAVAAEVASEPRTDDEGLHGPDDETRERFRTFARTHAAGLTTERSPII
jgi:hypothetical protein